MMSMMVAETEPYFNHYYCTAHLLTTTVYIIARGIVAKTLTEIKYIYSLAEFQVFFHPTIFGGLA